MDPRIFQFDRGFTESSSNGDQNRTGKKSKNLVERENTNEKYISENSLRVSAEISVDDVCK